MPFIYIYVHIFLHTLCALVGVFSKHPIGPTAIFVSTGLFPSGPISDHHPSLRQSVERLCDGAGCTLQGQIDSLLIVDIPWLRHKTAKSNKVLDTRKGLVTSPARF